jgi:hypothetical protein
VRKAGREISQLGHVLMMDKQQKLWAQQWFGNASANDGSVADDRPAPRAERFISVRLYSRPSQLVELALSQLS